mgnify:CR=1 FL=1
MLQITHRHDRRLSGGGIALHLLSIWTGVAGVRGILGDNCQMYGYNCGPYVALYIHAILMDLEGFCKDPLQFFATAKCLKPEDIRRLVAPPQLTKLCWTIHRQSWSRNTGGSLWRMSRSGHRRQHDPSTKPAWPFWRSPAMSASIHTWSLRYITGRKW